MIINNLMNATILVQINREKGEGPGSLHYVRSKIKVGRIYDWGLLAHNVKYFYANIAYFSHLKIAWP